MYTKIMNFKTEANHTLMASRKDRKVGNKRSADAYEIVQESYIIAQHPKLVPNYGRQTLEKTLGAFHYECKS